MEREKKPRELFYFILFIFVCRQERPGVGIDSQLSICLASACLAEPSKGWLAESIQRRQASCSELREKRLTAPWDQESKPTLPSNSLGLRSHCAPVLVQVLVALFPQEPTGTPRVCRPACKGDHGSLQKT